MIVILPNIYFYYYPFPAGASTFQVCRNCRTYEAWNREINPKPRVSYSLSSLQRVPSTPRFPPACWLTLYLTRLTNVASVPPLANRQHTPIERKEKKNRERRRKWIVEVVETVSATPFFFCKQKCKTRRTFFFFPSRIRQRRENIISGLDFILDPYHQIKVEIVFNFRPRQIQFLWLPDDSKTRLLIFTCLFFVLFWVCSIWLYVANGQCCATQCGWLGNVHKSGRMLEGV